MLKIPKGLKKKKKGKKKKDQELFTEEELEQYKHEQARKAAEAAALAAANEAPEEGNDEEWSKFAALTTGVDSMLKKTQDDLDRIKETSFFQRVAPKLEETKASPEEPEEDEETKKEKQVQALKEAVVELSESEYESEDDMSVFDTEFMEKADIPLTIVPDSPTYEEDNGEDIFDTAYAEKVIKGPEVSKTGKKIVSIGAAVHVLTGAVDNVPKSTVVKRPKRRGIQNLMLSSIDLESEDPVPDTSKDNTTANKQDPLDSLFDLELEETEPVEIDLSVSLHVKYKENIIDEGDINSTNEDNKNDDIDVLKEFDVLQDEDDEFAQLATESLKKPVEVIQVIEKVTPPEPIVPESIDWAEFEQTNDPEIEAIDDFDIDMPVDDDPFNTEFAETVLPKVDSFEELARESLVKEPKKIAPARPVPPMIVPEINLLEDENTTPTREELARRKSSLSLSINAAKNVQFSVPTPDPMKTDIEFSALIRQPLTPYYSKEEEEEEPEVEVDPFDTSFVPSVQPSRLELNYIEKEMLKTIEDDDFDPRAVTPEPAPSKEASTKETQKPTISEPDPIPVESDPFGTSMFDEDKYSALAVIDDSHKVVQPSESDKLDILTNTLAETSVHVKVMTPHINPTDSFEMDDIDPFDTTFAEKNTVPGETELKLIESEFIH